jgi:hypothetical protein
VREKVKNIKGKAYEELRNTSLYHFSKMCDENATADEKLDAYAELLKLESDKMEEAKKHLPGWIINALNQAENEGDLIATRPQKTISTALHTLAQLNADKTLVCEALRQLLVASHDHPLSTLSLNDVRAKQVEGFKIEDDENETYKTAFIGSCVAPRREDYKLEDSRIDLTDFDAVSEYIKKRSPSALLRDPQDVSRDDAIPSHMEKLLATLKEPEDGQPTPTSFGYPFEDETTPELIGKRVKELYNALSETKRGEVFKTASINGGSEETAFLAQDVYDDIVHKLRE